MSLHANLIECWYIYHEKAKGFRPTLFTGSDAKAIKQIRQRILSILPDKNEDTALGIFKTALNVVYKDKWLKTQPLQTINSRFDEILFTMKNQVQNEPENKINEYLNKKYA